MGSVFWPQVRLSTSPSNTIALYILNNYKKKQKQKNKKHLLKAAKKGGKQENRQVGKKKWKKEEKINSSYTSEVFNKFGLALTYRLSYNLINHVNYKKYLSNFSLCIW